MINWHIGCSGFYYKGWKGTFYPEDLPQSKWFNFYMEHFKTVEINSTFYRFPLLKTLKGWFDKTPEEFRFIVKANRLITHYKKFNDVKEPLAGFYELVKTGLAEKAAGILFQMPPSYHYSQEALERICKETDRAFNNIFEFRHESWWREDVYKTLGEHNITFCGISHPKLPEDVIANAELLYYRFHGRPKLYDSPYSDKELKKIYKEIKSKKKVIETFLFFNNDMSTNAVYNAKTIKKIAEYQK